MFINMPSKVDLNPYPIPWIYPKTFIKRLSAYTYQNFQKSF